MKRYIHYIFAIALLTAAAATAASVFPPLHLNEEASEGTSWLTTDDVESGGEATAETTTIYLSDLELSHVTNGWSSIKKDKTIDNRTINLRGAEYEKGLGIHANSKAVIRINGATTFHTICGIDNEAAAVGNVNWQIILIDENNRRHTVRWKNATRASAPDTVDIDNLQNWKYMLLDVDMNGGDSNDHFDWADAYFACPADAEAPVTVAVNTLDNTANFGGNAATYLTDLGVLSTNAGTVPERLVDGNPTRKWHSQETAPAGGLPHYLQVELGLTSPEWISPDSQEDLIVSVTRCDDRDEAAPTDFKVLASTDGTTFTDWADIHLPYRGTGTVEYSERIPVAQLPDGTRYLRFCVTANVTGQVDGGGNPRMRLAKFNVTRRSRDTGYSVTREDNYRLKTDYLMDYYEASFENTMGFIDPRNNARDNADLAYGHFSRWGSEKSYGTSADWCDYGAMWTAEGTLTTAYQDLLSEAGIEAPSFDFITLPNGQKRQRTTVIEHEVYALQGDIVALYPYNNFSPDKLSFNENFIHWYDYNEGGDAGGALDMLIDPSRVILTRNHGFFAGATDFSKVGQKTGKPMGSNSYGWKDLRTSEEKIYTGDIDANGESSANRGRVATFHLPHDPFGGNGLQPLPADREYVIACDVSSSFYGDRNLTADGSGIIEPAIHYRHLFRIKDGAAFAEEFSGSAEANARYIAARRRTVTAPAGLVNEIHFDHPVPQQNSTPSALYYKAGESDYRRVHSMDVVVTDAGGSTVDNTGYEMSGSFNGYGSRAMDGVTYRTCGGGGSYWRSLRLKKELAPGRYTITLYAKDYSGNRIQVGGTDLMVQVIEVTLQNAGKAYFKRESTLTDPVTGSYTDAFAHTSDAYLADALGEPAAGLDYDEFLTLEQSELGANLTGTNADYDKSKIYKWPLAAGQTDYAFGFPVRGDCNYYTITTNTKGLRYAVNANTRSAAENFGVGQGLFDRRFYATGGTERGYFYYVNAAADPGTLARIDLGDKVTPGSTIYCTAWIAETALDGSYPDRASVAFNLMAVVNDPDSTRIPVHSHISGVYPKDEGMNKSEWERVYFAFEPDLSRPALEGKSVARYELLLVNNISGSSGGDYCIDDVRVYIGAPQVYARHTNPGVAQPTVKVSVPFDGLLRHLGESTGEEVSLHYTILDKAAYESRFDELTNGGTAAGEAAAQAYADAVTGREEGTTFGTVTFSTTFGSNPEYSAPTEENRNLGMALTEDGEQRLAFNILPAGLEPGKEYLIYLTGEGSPAGSTDLTADAALFRIGNKAEAMHTAFTLIASTTVRIDGIALTDPSEPVMRSAGQRPVVSVDLVGETAAGQYVSAGRNARVDWFDGTADEFRETAGLKEALTAFRAWSKDARSVPATRPDEIAEADWTLIDGILRPLTQPGTATDGTATAPRLLLGSRHYTFAPLPAATEGELTDKAVTALPYASASEEITVNTEPVTVTLVIAGNAPQMRLGVPGITYPELMADVTVRAGLRQIARASGSRDEVTALAETSLHTLRIPVSEARSTDGSEHPLTRMADSPELLFIATDDPAYNTLTNPEAEMFTSAGRVIRIGADKACVAFYSSFTLREGYTYRFRIAFKESDTEGTAEGQTFFNLRIVPEYLIWTGAENRNWHNDRNWRRPTQAELHTSGDTQAQDSPVFFPGSTSKVIIPAETDTPRTPYLIAATSEVTHDSHTWSGNAIADSSTGEAYSAPFDGTAGDPVYDLTIDNASEGCEAAPFAANECAEIHFSSGASIMGQQHLAYGKAWVDLEIAPGAWSTLSSPLQQLYSGEMYAPTAGARQETELFTPITFDASLHDRFAPAIYQRAWNTASATIYKKHPGSDEVTTESGRIVTNWSRAYNDAKVLYGTGLGYSVKADISGITGDAPDRLLIRLPKADTNYGYYHHGDADASGSHSDFTAALDRTAHHRLNPAESTVTATSATADNRYFLLGNPFMSHIDMARFLAANAGKLEPMFWLVSSDGTSSGATVFDESGTATGTAGSVLAPMQGFFVQLKEGYDGTSQEFVYDASMMAERPAADAPGSRAATPALTVTAVATGSRAMVAVRPDASAGYDASEDAALFSDESLDSGVQVYTLAGDIAATVNSTDGIEGTRVGVVAPRGSAVTLRFDGPDADGLMLLDRTDGTVTTLADGGEATVTQGHDIILTRSPGIAGDTAAESLAVHLVGNRAEASTDADGLTVEIHDLAGRLLDCRSTTGRHLTVALPARTVIVTATDGNGRRRSAKFVVPGL